MSLSKADRGPIGIYLDRLENKSFLWRCATLLRVFEAGGRESAGAAVRGVRAMSKHEREVATQVDGALASVDVAKRETLRKLILGAAFVVPVVASFSVSALTSRARATEPCLTTSGCTTRD